MCVRAWCACARVHYGGQATETGSNSTPGFQRPFFPRNMSHFQREKCTIIIFNKCPLTKKGVNKYDDITRNENKVHVYLFNESSFDSASAKLRLLCGSSSNIGVSKINVMDLNGFKLINDDSSLMRNVH